MIDTLKAPMNETNDIFLFNEVEDMRAKDNLYYKYDEKNLKVRFILFDYDNSTVKKYIFHNMNEFIDIFNPDKDLLHKSLKYFLYNNNLFIDTAFQKNPFDKDNFDLNNLSDKDFFGKHSYLLENIMNLERFIVFYIRFFISYKFRDENQLVMWNIFNKLTYIELYLYSRKEK